jgi:hypothetical protein
MASISPFWFWMTERTACWSTTPCAFAGAVNAASQKKQQEKILKARKLAGIRSPEGACILLVGFIIAGLVTVFYFTCYYLKNEAISGGERLLWRGKM